MDSRKNRLGISQAELRKCRAVYRRVADAEAGADGQSNINRE